MVVKGEFRVDIERIEEFGEVLCISKREEDKECRICHEEGEESSMETPCACNGTLKFVHRKCVQKWCNLKGNITCEICNQIFTPNYSATPPRRTDHSNDTSVDIRFLSWVSTQYNRYFLAATPDDFENYSMQHNKNIAVCHILILVLMLLLLIEHVIVVTKDATVVEDDKVFFNISIVQLAGIILPCYVIIRSFYFHLRCCLERHDNQIWM